MFQVIFAVSFREDFRFILSMTIRIAIFILSLSGPVFRRSQAESWRPSSHGWFKKWWVVLVELVMMRIMDSKCTQLYRCVVIFLDCWMIEFGGFNLEIHLLPTSLFLRGRLTSKPISKEGCHAQKNLKLNKPIIFTAEFPKILPQGPCFRTGIPDQCWLENKACWP